MRAVLNETFFAAVAQVLPTLMIAHAIEFGPVARQVIGTLPDDSSARIKLYLRLIVAALFTSLGGVYALGVTTALLGLLHNWPSWLVWILTAVSGIATLVAVLGVVSAPVRAVHNTRD